jgi:hypothetical protein
MKDSGLLAAGYNYITLGGMGFAENGDPQAVPGFPKIPRQNISRNASGFLQADPARFPGRVTAFVGVGQFLRLIVLAQGFHLQSPIIPLRPSHSFSCCC